MRLLLPIALALVLLKPVAGVAGEVQDNGLPQQVDKLKLVNAAGSSIAKGNDGLFREVNGGALPSDPLATVTSGSLEGSNVNSTQALIDMIEASRAWETQVKMIDTAKQLDDGGASLMRLDG